MWLWILREAFGKRGDGSLESLVSHGSGGSIVHSAIQKVQLVAQSQLSHPALESSAMLKKEEDSSGHDRLDQPSIPDNSPNDTGS